MTSSPEEDGGTFLKSITYLSLLLKFVLRSHHSGTHFPQKNLVIAQFGYGSARAWLGEKARWRIWSQDGEGGSGGGGSNPQDA